MKEPFSGPWAIKWHDMIWGPIESEDKARALIPKPLPDKAPQDVQVFPLWNPAFLTEIVKEYEE